MTATSIQVRSEGAIVRITLEGDAQLNALDIDGVDAVREALVAASAEDATRVVILTGAGRAFCTGANLARIPAETSAAMDAGNALIREMLNASVPIIAAVNGPAVGFGVSLVVAADVAVAAQSSYFLLPFTMLGLMPDGGLTHTLPAVLGRARAGEYALAGRRLCAAEAETAGLVSRVVPDDDLAAAADSVARRIVDRPRRALTLTKQALNASSAALLDAAFDRERTGQIELLATREFAQRSAPWVR